MYIFLCIVFNFIIITYLYLLICPYIGGNSSRLFNVGSNSRFRGDRLEKPTYKGITKNRKLPRVSQSNSTHATIAYKNTETDYCTTNDFSNPDLIKSISLVEIPSSTTCQFLSGKIVLTWDRQGENIVNHTWISRLPSDCSTIDLT